MASSCGSPNPLLHPAHITRSEDIVTLAQTRRPRRRARRGARQRGRKEKGSRCYDPAAAMNYTFNWSVLWTGQSGHWLLQGLLTTLAISGLAWLLAVALGIRSEERRVG